MSWDPSIATAAFSDKIQCIAWSPCSRFIAISFEKWMGVWILDAVTLKRLKYFTSPNRPTGLLTFSPEGRSLVWFSDTSEVFTSLDFQTGVQIGEIPTEEHPLSITHSGCGKMLGVLFEDHDHYPSAINIYNIFSSTLIYRHPIERMYTDKIWRHDDCTRFITAGPGSITPDLESWLGSISVWEVGFSSELPPTEVESFPTPNDPRISGGFLFRPTPPRLPFIPYPEGEVESFPTSDNFDLSTQFPLHSTPPWLASIAYPDGEVESFPSTSDSFDLSTPPRLASIAYPYGEVESFPTSNNFDLSTQFSVPSYPSPARLHCCSRENCHRAGSSAFEAPPEFRGCREAEEHVVLL